METLIYDADVLAKCRRSIFIKILTGATASVFI